MRKYRGLTKNGEWVYGWYIEVNNKHFIVPDDAFAYQEKDSDYNGFCIHDYHNCLSGLIEVIPETVGQQTGLCYEGDYVVMDCWNGGDGYEEPNRHDIFEGIVVYDKKICRWGLQTKLCDEGQIEVGLEDSQFTSIEIIGNIHQNPELMEKK